MSEFQSSLEEAMAVFASLNEHEGNVENAAQWCVEALSTGAKLLICGNGGSASEAHHLAGELMGRFKKDRVPLAAIALAADTTILTCIGNDYCFEDIFARQVRALARQGDILIVFTTSGNSPNVLSALESAKESGVKTIAFLGREGGKAKNIADCSLIVRHQDTARVQEGHQFLMHCFMDRIEQLLGLRE